MSQKVLLNAKEVNIILHRLACQLIENHNDFSNTVLIGIQPRGKFLAERLCNILREEYKIKNVQLGQLDITFFRDDFRRGDKPLEANTTEIDFVVENKKVVFIDDVLYTGRSIRAALTAIQSFGRPSEIEYPAFHKYETSERFSEPPINKLVINPTKMETTIAIIQFVFVTFFRRC